MRGKVGGGAGGKGGGGVWWCGAWLNLIKK